MTKTLLSATALIALSTAAQAQDAAFDWNGWYLGAQTGLSQHQATYEDPDFDWNGHTMDFLSLGFSAGVQAGFNLVRNNGLSGMEFDLSHLGNSTTSIYASRVNVANAANYIATLRARTGLAVDDTLIFATGGLAFADVDRSWTEVTYVPGSWPDLGAGKLGVVLGFGVEHAINGNWSVRGEYTHTIFGENTSVNGDGYPLGISDNIHRLSFGVNYALGIGARGTTGAGVGTPADFSGAYIGAYLGPGIADISESDIAQNDFGGSYDVGNIGGLAGLSAGYNWQHGASVFGIEGRLSYSGLAEGYLAAGTAISTGVDHTASLRGRAGLVAGNTLMYVMGGVTLAQVTNRMHGDTSGTYTGLTIGAGVERFVTDSLAWNVESAFTRFDAGDDAGGDLFHGSADMIAVSAGLNYRLGGPRSAGTGALAPSHNWGGTFWGLDAAVLANQGSVWDQDFFDFGGQFDLTSFGGGLGAHIGHNWQTGSFVYGAIADVAVFSNDEARTGANRQVSSALSGMGTLRGRAGIASGNSFFYMTGGLAVAQSHLTHEELPGPDPDSFDLSDTRIGTVAGIGLEHALNDRSSIRIEALFTRFNAESYFNGRDCPGPVGFDGGACNMDGWDTGGQIRAAMSWRF